MIVAFVVSTGAVVGLAVAWIARRWPVVEAPKVDVHTIATEVVRHSRFERHLRRRTDPHKETGLALTVATLVAAAGAVGIGVLLAMVRTHEGFARLDLRLARYGAEHATELSTRFMRDLSQLGGTQWVIVLAVIVGIVEYVRAPSHSIAPFLALCVLGQFAVSNLVKYAVGRARPDLHPLTGFAGSSFPSGHSTAAAASFAAFALLMGRRRSPRVKIILAGIAAGIAAAVASTRVFLGVHWFTDVVAGLLGGWGWFALCSIAFGGRLLRFGAPVEAAERVAERLVTSSHVTRR